MLQARDPVARLKARVQELGWRVAIDEALAFERPELKDLYALWREKAEQLGTLPRREDLSARMLKAVLPHISIVERVPDEGGMPHFRFRLHGTSLAQQFGDLTGAFLEKNIPDNLVVGWNLGYDAILETALPLRVLSFYRTEKVNYLTGESFAVPLGNGDKPPVQLFAATYFHPRTVLPPDR